jgi:hypothetical protein
MVVRANQEAAFEPMNAVLKGKPHVFERRTIHHSESAQWVKAYCVHRNDELPPV